ncbi:MAG TPA: alpha/beta hydrolase [Burkholderiales bacterium]|jgi:pimeloyl-ACP methyl ester carboxylesterase|nr:alpha/beta hydrolase [Burkholderiales bacterium]
MRTQLISITTDTIPLAGAFHEPDGGSTAGAVLMFHGNTMNFYSGALRFLPPVLTRAGFACLAFNRRGHDILSTRASRVAEGGAFQLTREAIADNRFAAQWLAARGFPHPVVIGHSNGGMLGVRHVVDHPQTPALILLSAGRGGKRSVQDGARDGLFAGERFDEICTQARALVNAGRGRELMFMPGWWYVISAESFLDRIETVPDTLALAPQIKCPALFIRGDKEPRDRYPAEEFQQNAGGACKVEIVPNCDHFYNDREDAVADLVSSWLAQTLVAAAA